LITTTGGSKTFGCETRAPSFCEAAREFNLRSDPFETVDHAFVLDDAMTKLSEGADKD